MESAFEWPAEDVLAHFEVNAASGLKDHQVAALRAKHGKNGM